jgi:hypothetical protein
MTKKVKPLHSERDGLLRGAVEEHSSGRQVRNDVRAVEGRRLIPGRNAGYPDAALTRRRELSRRDYDVPIRYCYRVSPAIIVIVLAVIIVIVFTPVVIPVVSPFVPVVVPILPPVFVPVVIRRSRDRTKEKDKQAYQDRHDKMQAGFRYASHALVIP